MHSSTVYFMRWYRKKKILIKKERKTRKVHKNFTKLCEICILYYSGKKMK